jgi:hypothetical protein
VKRRVLRVSSRKKVEEAKYDKYNCKWYMKEVSLLSVSNVYNNLAASGRVGQHRIGVHIYDRHFGDIMYCTIVHHLPM